MIVVEYLVDKEVAIMGRVPTFRDSKIGDYGIIILCLWSIRTGNYD